MTEILIGLKKAYDCNLENIKESKGSTYELAGMNKGLEIAFEKFLDEEYDYPYYTVIVIEDGCYQTTLKDGIVVKTNMEELHVGDYYNDSEILELVLNCEGSLYAMKERITIRNYMIEE